MVKSKIARTILETAVPCIRSSDGDFGDDGAIGEIIVTGLWEFEQTRYKQRGRVFNIDYHARINISRGKLYANNAGSCSTDRYEIETRGTRKESTGRSGYSSDGAWVRVPRNSAWILT